MWKQGRNTGILPFPSNPPSSYLLLLCSSPFLFYSVPPPLFPFNTLSSYLFSLFSTLFPFYSSLLRHLHSPFLLTFFPFSSLFSFLSSQFPHILYPFLYPTFLSLQFFQLNRALLCANSTVSVPQLSSFSR